MRRLSLRLLATFVSLSALTTCVDVPQDPPYRTANPFTVAEFDTARAKVPFPITLPCPRAVDPTTGACPGGGTYDSVNNRVAIPITPCQAGQTPCIAPGNPAGCTACDSAQAATFKAGLNTLDGFSTYAPLRTTFDKPIDPATLAGNAFLLDTTTGLPADFVPSFVTIDAGKPSAANTLLFVPRRPAIDLDDQMFQPLKPGTNYLAVIKTGVKDTNGKNIAPDRSFAFLRSRTPLANADGTAIPDSLLANLSPADVGCTGSAAAQEACLNGFRAATEATRQRFNDIFNTLEQNPAFKREDVALLWPVRTESIANALVGIRAQIIGTGAIPRNMTTTGTLPGVAVYQPRGIPVQDIKVQQFRLGCMLSPTFLRPPNGTFAVNAQGVPQVAPQRIPYVLALPDPAHLNLLGITKPKVVIFGHGLGRWRYDVIAIANTLATFGFATVAIDHVWHGSRSNLVLGSENPDLATCQAGLPSADGNPPVLCSDPAGTYDAGTNTCSAGTPVPSGSRMFPIPNFFALRDNFRQAAIDLQHLTQAIRANTAEFDTSQIFYVGQSLGAMIGTLFVATEPYVQVAALNVGGGSLVNIFQETQRLAICKPIADGLAAAGICVRADPTGQPCACDSLASQYVQFFQSAQMAMDQGDPINYGRYLIEQPLWCTTGQGPAPCAAAPGAPPIAKKILFQRMLNDDTVPTATQHHLRGTIGARACYRKFEGGTNHGFLLNPGNPQDANFAETRAVTVQAQTQVGSFFASGGQTTRLPAQGGTAADACPQ